MREFVHHNTDGADKPFSPVYDAHRIRTDFADFELVECYKRYVHAPPLPVHTWPGGRRAGWHLWAHCGRPDLWSVTVGSRVSPWLADEMFQPLVTRSTGRKVGPGRYSRVPPQGLVIDAGAGCIERLTPRAWGLRDHTPCRRVVPVGGVRRRASRARSTSSAGCARWD
jgi:hypothetical protein